MAGPVHTLGKEAIFARLRVLAQEPAVAKVVVALNQLDAVAAPQAQLVRAPGQKLVCSFTSTLDPYYAKHSTGRRCKAAGVRGNNIRTTTRVSPGRQLSVWERWAMLVKCGQDLCRRVVVAALQARWWVVASKGGSHLSVKLHLVVDVASRRRRWRGRLPGGRACFGLPKAGYAGTLGR